jgi:hypothetical protein
METRIMNVGAFMRSWAARSAVCICAAAMVAQAAAAGEPAQGETLYNGIVLPKEWPPKLLHVPRDPVTPWYVTSPPAVIPIDVGRQLFVDDFLIENSTLKRGFHRAEYYPANPVYGQMPFSGGIWWDPKDQNIKLFAGGSMATSKDGIHFNQVSNSGGGDTVFLDMDAKDPQKRWVRFGIQNAASNRWENIHRYNVWFSADGMSWGEVAKRTGNFYGDRASAFYNPFRKVWVYSIRWGACRRRRYWEVKDLVNAPNWPDWKFSDEEGLYRTYYFPDPPSALTDGRPNFWTGSDSADFVRPDIGSSTDLYNLDCVAYESVLLGEFVIHRGEPEYRVKINEVCLGFSRDGFNFARPDRKAFCPVSDRFNDWNYVNVQSVGGCCLVVGDRLYFYVSGRSDHGMVTGLAFLRRDGFASMDAGPEGGTLTTRPVAFKGKRLFVNVDVPQGELRAEVLDAKGAVIAPFSADKCKTVRGDKTLQEVTWEGAGDLSALANKTVKFRFQLKNGSLYSFWVSPDESGASYGYVAGGGPGFTAHTDTVGIAAYKAAGPAPAMPRAPAKTIDGGPIAPVRVAGEPNAVLPAGTRQAVIRLVTYEDAICKYADKPGVPYADMQFFTSTGGMRHAAIVKGLTDGAVKTFYVKGRNVTGKTNDNDYLIDVGIADPGPAAAAVVIDIEAESAAVTAPMSVVDDANASGGKTAMANQNSAGSGWDPKGSVVITFNAPAAGTYWVWAHVYGPGAMGISDSFFTSMDGKNQEFFDLAERPWGLIWNKWHWTTLTARDGLKHIARVTKAYPLAKGEHKLMFGGRKAGCKIDRIIITNDPSVSSSGEQAPVRNGPRLPAENPTDGAGPKSEGPVEVNGVLTAPAIWPDGGNSGRPVAVAFSWPLSADGPETVIRYTMDGTDPGENSPAYAAPFTVSGAVTVKARAYRQGAKPSAVTVANFNR